MLFYSSSEGTIDQSGRLKLGTDYLTVFSKQKYQAVLLCNFDGALAIYPKSEWDRYLKEIYAQIDEEKEQDRHRKRNILYFSKEVKISNQGRITVPINFRRRCLLEAGANVMVGGNGECIEVWNLENWDKVIKKG